MDFLKNLSIKLHKPPSKEEFDALPQIGTIEKPQLITFQPTDKAFGKNFVILVRVGPYGSWYRPSPPLLFLETDDEGKYQFYQPSFNFFFQSGPSGCGLPATKIES